MFLSFTFNNGLSVRRADVIKAVGKPDYTEEDSGGAKWYYKNRTIDPMTGKRDSLAIVEFGDPFIYGYRAGYEHVAEVSFR